MHIRDIMSDVSGIHGGDIKRYICVPLLVQPGIQGVISRDISVYHYLYNQAYREVISRDIYVYHY